MIWNVVGVVNTMSSALRAVMVFFTVLAASGSSCRRSGVEVEFGIISPEAINKDINVSVNCSQRNTQFNWNIPEQLSMDIDRMILQYSCSNNPDTLVTEFDDYGSFLSGTRSINITYSGLCTYSGCVFIKDLPTNFTSITCARHISTNISSNNTNITLSISELEPSSSTSTTPSSQLLISISPTSSHKSSVHTTPATESVSSSLFITSSKQHSLTHHSTTTSSSLLTVPTQHSFIIKVAAPLLVTLMTVIILVLSVLVCIIYSKRKLHRVDRELMKNCADFYNNNCNLESNYILDNFTNARKLSHSSSAATLINGFSTDNGQDTISNGIQLDRPTSLFLYQNTKLIPDLFSSNPDLHSYNLSNEVYQNDGCRVYDNIEVDNGKLQKVFEESTSEQCISANTTSDLGIKLSSRSNSIIYHFDVEEEGPRHCDCTDNSYVCLSIDHLRTPSNSEDKDGGIITAECHALSPHPRDAISPIKSPQLS